MVNSALVADMGLLRSVLSSAGMVFRVVMVKQA